MSKFVFTYNVGLDTFRWQIPLMTEWFSKQSLPGNYLELFLFAKNDALAKTDPSHPEALVADNAREFGSYVREHGIDTLQVHYYLLERLYDGAGTMLLRVLDFLSVVKEEHPDLDISMNHHYIHKSSLEGTDLTRSDLLRFAANDTRQALEIINRYGILTALRRENNPPLHPESRKFMNEESDYGDLVPEDALLLPNGVEAMLDIAHAYATVLCLNEIVEQEIKDHGHPMSGNMRALVEQYEGIPGSCASFETYVDSLSDARKIGWAHIANIREPNKHENLIPFHEEGIIDMRDVLITLSRHLESDQILPVTVEVDFPYIKQEREGGTPIRDSIAQLYEIASEI